MRALVVVMLALVAAAAPGCAAVNDLNARARGEHPSQQLRPPPAGAVVYQHADGRKGWCKNRAADYALSLQPFAAVTAVEQFAACKSKFESAGFVRG